MERREIYFDNNATTRPLPEVRDAVLDTIGEEFGNPSSAHSTGERARLRLREARDNLAALLDCSPSEITFTGSGTESNNMAFYSCTRDKKKKCRVVTTSVEHSSIQKMCSYLCINGVEIKMVGCSVYVGGGAKSEKRARCVNQCEDKFESCSGTCKE